METSLRCVLVLFHCISIIFALEADEIPHHYDISSHILRRYNRDLIPKKRQNESVKVQFSMELYQIIEVNEPQQYLTLNSWIVERWADSMLGWDPDLYDNTREIMLSHNKIWIPDTTLYNSLVMKEDETRRLLNAKLTSMNDTGAFVELLYPTIYRLSCNLELKFFPFDVQSCKLTFGSWTYDNTYIDYFPYNISHAIGTSNCIENEGWKVLGTRVERKELKYSCCPNNYTLLDFYIKIQRKPLYYVINLIVPTSIITFISIVGFFNCSSINDIREEKITLGITTLLSMSILILMVSDKMPSTSSFIPLIGLFYTCMIFLISFATIFASFVIFIQKKGFFGDRPSDKMMRWSRIIGKYTKVELPLLMKQAYEQKAREDKLRMGKRKQSLWQKVYKMSKVVNALGANGKPANRLINSQSEPTSKTSGLVMNTEEHSDKTSSPSPLKSTLVDFTPMIDADEESQEDFKPVKKPAKLLWTQSCASYDSMMKNVIEPPIEPLSPSSERRNLAQLEYDFLAAVVERVFLIFFITAFIISSVGINGAGYYYWKMETPMTALQ